MNFQDALGHIATGLDFERVGVDIVKARTEAKMSELAAMFELEPAKFLGTAIDLETELRRIADIAATRKIDLAKQIDAAWESMKKRLVDHSPGDLQTPAALAEILTAVRGLGPAATLGLDIERIPLSRWSSALISIAAESTNPPKRTVPTWAAAFALRQLGGRTLARAPMEMLLDRIAWHTTTVPGTPLRAPDELSALAQTERLGDGMSNRWAVIVRNSRNSLTASWNQPPELGLALVLEQQQLGFASLFPMLEEAFPGTPALIAWEEPFESPEFQRSFRPNLSQARAATLTQCHLYPRAEGALKPNAIVDPAGPDAVFRRIAAASA